MQLTRFALLSVVLAGCHLQAGFDAASRVNGPLHTLMNTATVSRSDGVTNLPPADGGGSYSGEAGFGNKTISLNAIGAVHDVTQTSFTPGAGYIAATAGANVRWQAFHWKGLSPSLAAGPVRMVLLDRTNGDRTWGNGLRVDAGLQYKLGPIAVYGDAYHEVVSFSSGPAQGTTTLDGITVGLSLAP